MAQVILKDVSKSYDGQVKVVTDFNLEVGDGEFIVLVGPSGCGKSTTLRMVAGLEELTGGTIQIGDRVVNDVPPKDRDIAMVFQSYALYPHMTVRDNIAFPLKVRRLGLAEVEERVTRVADMLGLGRLLDRRPRDLSGGQRQRVAMGRAIVREPKVFLFDEPLSNLDAALRTRMRAEIAELHARLSATMIYVTHDQHEAMTLADRIVLLNLGHIEQQGAPLELYQRPRTRFTGEFMGSPPMNFLPVEKKPDSLASPHLRVTRSELGITDWDALPGELVLGVRPEALRLADRVTAPHRLDVQVSWIERTGSDAYVHSRAGEIPVVARVAVADGERLSAGSTVTLAFDALSVFDRDSGQAVAHR
jgi:multiple sugar transport system ATP-binding protein